MRRPFLSFIYFAVTISLMAQAPVLDTDALAGLRARDIGPAVMSGRIAALDGTVEKGRITLYIGAASGGVWKTQNGGSTWKPVFDKHNQSIGAVRMDPKDPRTVWVGTGECWVRNSVSVGDGIYRTTDGGENWTRMGLADSERIADILVDPVDTRRVFAAAMGRLWAPGGERGVYRTTDGGATWTRVLHVDESTGCSGLAMDPRNPKVLLAAMWDYRRTGWSFRSGGPGSGLWRSEDGGETWKKLTGDPATGLPGGTLGRIAVAVAPSDPNIVYATLEAKEGALYRSEDGGKTWQERFKGAKVLARPFYFGAMTVDPKNPDRVYKMGYMTAVSEDGGKTFDQIGAGTHGDHHALWIHPGNTELLYLGEDAGFFTSEDRGASWKYHKNLPIAQFYHVSADGSRPYRLFGGLQDNSTWMGFGSVRLSNRHWQNIYYGDGFWAFADPSDPSFAYAEMQGGDMGRVDLRSNVIQNIRPQEKAGEPKFRWNWNTPIYPSPNHKGVIYVAAQYLFRSKDHGNTWERLGGDLTTNNPEKQKQEESGGLILDNSSAENHCTIYTVSESPKNPKVLWVGTDDGNLQLSRDGGKTWTNLVAKVPGLPAGTSVSWIEASSHREGTAFAAFDGHTRGDMATYLYRTDDFGGTWKPLATPDLKGFAHVLKQDPAKDGLLFLGTEAGLFVSVDGGSTWARFKGGDFPPVPVRDLFIQTQENDLVIATHGRGIWIIDDLTPLRALDPQTLAKDVALLPTRPAKAMEALGDGWVDGALDYRGEDAPRGAQIAYWQKKRHLFGDMKIEILDAKGAVLRSFPANKGRGFNRMIWDRRMKPPRVAAGVSLSYAGFAGPEVLEGIYTVRFTKGKDVISAPLTLLPDPGSPFTAEDRKARFDASMELFGMLDDMTYTVDRIRQIRDDAASRAKDQKAGDLAPRLEALSKAAEEARGKFVPVKEVEGITGEERLREKVSDLYSAVNQYPGRPSRAQLDRIEALRKDIRDEAESFESKLKKELAGLNGALSRQGLEPLAPLDHSTWDSATAKK